MQLTLVKNCDDIHDLVCLQTARWLSHWCSEVQHYYRPIRWPEQQHNIIAAVRRHHEKLACQQYMTIDACPLLSAECFLTNANRIHVNVHTLHLSRH